jgi:peptidoglycan/LPS O-acetylase OafA/YrhL
MVPPPARDHRYHALDIWRGVICLIVVLEHASICLHPGQSGAGGFEGFLRRALAAPLSWNLGAPLFFVISGYCIAASIDSHRRKGGNGFTFLARRAWRIFPPYWAAFFGFIAVVVGLDMLGLTWLHNSANALAIPSPAVLSPSQWLGNLTLTETWRYHFGGSELNILTRVAWSLCYQEQFYLICFLALMLAPRRLYGALASATAAILAFRVFTWDSGGDFRYAGLFPDLWHEFAVGLAVYWRLNVATAPLAKRAVEAAIGLLGAIALAQGVATTVGASVLALLLIALRPLDNRFRSLAWLDPLRALGRRSYSIYLAHLPPCVVVSVALTELAGVAGFWARVALVLPLASAAAIAAGWAFHHLVDRHFQQLPQGLPWLPGHASPVRPRVDATLQAQGA